VKNGQGHTEKKKRKREREKKKGERKKERKETCAQFLPEDLVLLVVQPGGREGKKGEGEGEGKGKKKKHECVISLRPHEVVRGTRRGGER